MAIHIFTSTANVLHKISSFQPRIMTHIKKKKNTLPREKAINRTIVRYDLDVGTFRHGI